jgi:hypothetical protein
MRRILSGAMVAAALGATVAAGAAGALGGCGAVSRTEHARVMNELAVERAARAEETEKRVAAERALGEGRRGAAPAESAPAKAAK